MWSRQAGSRSNDLSNVCGWHRCSHYRIAVRVYADVGEIGRPRRRSVRFRSRCRPAIRWTANCRASAAGGDDRATHYARPSHASVGRDDRRSSDTHATLWDAGRITRPQSLETWLHVCCSLRVSVGVWLSRRVFVRNSFRGNPRRLFGQLLRRRYRQPKSPVAGWRRRLTAFRTPHQTTVSAGWRASHPRRIAGRGCVYGAQPGPHIRGIAQRVALVSLLPAVRSVASESLTCVDAGADGQRSS